MSQDSKFHHGDVPKDAKPIIHMENIQKHFGNVIALNGVTFDVTPGECHCLLGDNGAGKSTFIKTMSGVHKPTKGEIFLNGKPMAFSSPRDAMEAGIATVFQDLAMIPLMSVTRNFFMGREPTKGKWLFKRMDIDKANALLDEAGYPMENGERFELSIELPAFPGYRAQTEYIKQALTKVGITVNMNASPDFPSWAQTMGNMEFDLAMDSVYNWGDPVIGVNRTYMSSNIGKGVWSNTQGYSNARVDELLDMAATENDPDKRAALYKEFQEIVAEEVPIYFINAVPMHTIYSDKVGNPPVNGIWSTSSPLDKVYLKD